MIKAIVVDVKGAPSDGDANQRRIQEADTIAPFHPFE